MCRTWDVVNCRRFVSWTFAWLRRSTIHGPDCDRCVLPSVGKGKLDLVLLELYSDTLSSLPFQITMKFTIAALLAVAVSASQPQSKNTPKAKYMNNMLRNSKVVRGLQEDYPVDISSYSVKFQQCQFVKGFDDELAEQEESSTVLGTTRFALFRLCPNSCADECAYNYGEYILDLETYLESTVQYFQESEQERCNTCYEYCQNDGNDQGNNNGGRRLNDANANNANYDCTCLDDCEKMENMEENGYVDATDFMNCELIYASEDNGDGDVVEYYAAPVCTSQGSKIKIGVFSDQNCQVYEPDLEVEDYFEADDNGDTPQLSHALLKMTYQNTCISCLEVDENDENNNNQNGNNDAQDADNVLDICENLYNFAGKCEYSHGFTNGYYSMYGYENQASQEDVVCDFIQSLKSGTYDETGEINLSGASFSIGGGASTTGGQKFALTFFVLGTVGLAVYAAMLHSKLTKGGATGMEAGSGALA